MDTEQLPILTPEDLGYVEEDEEVAAEEAVAEYQETGEWQRTPRRASRSASWSDEATTTRTATPYEPASGVREPFFSSREPEEPEEDTDEQQRGPVADPAASGIHVHPRKSRPPPSAATPVPAPVPWTPPPLGVADDDDDVPSVPAQIDIHAFQDEWEAQAPRRSGGWLLWSAAAMVTGLALLAVILWIAWPPTPPALALPQPQPLEVAPTAAPSRRPSPRPPPRSRPPRRSPKPPPPRRRRRPHRRRPIPPPRSRPCSIAAGSFAGSNPSKAGALFREALELQPDHDEANYGYGYIMLMQNRRAEATAHLCRARSSSDPEIRTDVTGLIDHNALKCR
ncbi:MAG: tetratricopeptide repeat protein [Myxococcota bacterium]